MCSFVEHSKESIQKQHGREFNFIGNFKKRARQKRILQKPVPLNHISQWECWKKRQRRKCQRRPKSKFLNEERTVIGGNELRVPEIYRRKYRALGWWWITMKNKVKNLFHLIFLRCWSSF